MKKINLILVIIMIGFLSACHSDSNDDIPTPPNPNPSDQEFNYPNRELRAVWFTTVWELDWPLKKYDREQQQRLYIEYLDKIKEYNLNSIFVQVRSMADAFYESEYEPWSAWITGERGKNPGYDVLGFMLEEAHKRDLEFHAWINPFRISTRTSATSSFPDMKMDISSDMYVDYGKIRVYNPAEPKVHQRIFNIIDEIISKYDVDGIIFDDYFYPEPEAGLAFPDDADFKKYGGEYKSKEEFRRANVNNIVKGIHELIVSKKPKTKFAISPTAHRDHNYNNLYADVEFWTKEGWLDIVMPQLYQSTAQKFKDLAAYWSRFSWEATPMIAYGLYKFGDPQSGSLFMTKEELENQFKISKEFPRFQGHTFYSAKYFFENKIDIMDVIKRRFETPAIIPAVKRLAVNLPNQVKDLELVGDKLSWGTSESRFAVYLLPLESGSTKPTAKLIAITKEKSIVLTEKGRYFVTSLNDDNQESKRSSFIMFK